ncbi:hypothetical protein [Curtobacterium sp. Leaf261]|uniref:hypothetical protein n=1 Tax=Curtobacterium sp. Leaf261 TaxID=1736311 RepID=UPI0006F5BECA|nr:hypothetical protein [Curtobacterium sp. Leaf261]KQO59957.1 hypothetical protein ASF23_14990 [Curtobacterium sp. Leaf261]
MQAAPVLTSVIDVDLPEWLLVPPTVTEEWRAAVRDVFDTVTRVERELPEDGRLFEDGLVIDAEAAVEQLVRMAGDLEADDRLVASLVVPNRWPLPVIVSVGAADPDADLLDLAGATGGLPIDAPTVDELPPEVGGEGPVVTRFDLADDGAVMATVCCLRRADGVDTRVLWRTNDLAVVPVFLPSLVELVGAVRNDVQAPIDAGTDANARTDTDTDGASA